MQREVYGIPRWHEQLNRAPASHSQRAGVMEIVSLSH
jgi:hypothetical protein